MEYKVKILSIDHVTHNVNRYRFEKPEGYSFLPGQATEVSLNKEGFESNKHPFTFTCLNSEDYLEFTIKSYPISEFPNHSGVTEKLLSLVPGDELIIGDPWGTINYKGKGIFIAGGAGITPFIAILRDLKSKGELEGNRLFFSNKLEKDIILREELEEMFKDNPSDLILTLTQEEVSGLEHGRINNDFLNKHVTDFKINFYICGPRAMKMELIETVKGLGASVDSIVFEQ